MQRVTWLMVVGAVCVGCAKKEEVPLPNVSLDQRDQRIAVPLVEPPPKTFGLNYAQLWDPKGAEKPDLNAILKTALAQQTFAKHQTDFLAAATAGAMVSLTHGGRHGLVVPAALASTYPAVATKFETEAKNRMATIATMALGGAILDVSSQGTGAASTRMLVIRVKDGTDDELRAHFDEYATRMESAMKATGAMSINHQRREFRSAVSFSEVQYETESHTGYIRSAVVRGGDEKDTEFAHMMFDDATAGKGDGMFKMVMRQKGPFLIVALKQQRR